MTDHNPVTPAAVAEALAGLIQQHQSGKVPTISAASLPGVSGPWTNVSALGMGEYIPLALHLASKFRALPPERVSGYRERESASWTVLDVLGEQHSYPAGVSGLFEPGELTGFALVLQMATPKEASWSEESYMVRVHVAPAHGEAAQAWLQETMQKAEQECNILRGRVLELSRGSSGVMPTVVATPKASLSDVVVDTSVRQELEKNVMRHVASREALAKVGIGSNRGVLLWGPPGTGKTSLVRGCIAALAGEVTVLIPDAEAMAGALPAVYQEAARLAPCLVVLEDVDVVAADRHGKDAGLSAFLASLDGVVADPEKLVVTIATTNNPRGIDEAAKRPGRIDRMIEVPLPDVTMRRAILESYLAKLQAGGIEVQVRSFVLDNLANGAKGASGALLREVVRRSLLEAGGELGSVVQEHHLLCAAEEIGYRAVAPYQSGQYI